MLICGGARFCFLTNRYAGATNVMRRINVFNIAGLEMVMQAVGVPPSHIVDLVQRAEFPCAFWLFGCIDYDCDCEYWGYAARPLKAKTPFGCDCCNQCPGCGMTWTEEMIQEELKR